MLGYTKLIYEICLIIEKQNGFKNIFLTQVI
jgi:hypothetical protein